MEEVDSSTNQTISIDTTDMEKSKYTVSVPKHEEFEEESGKKKYVGYCIHVDTSDGESWRITKRYSDFLSMHSFLKAKKEHPEVQKFDFPKKEFGWLAFNEDVIQKRTTALDYYVKLLASLDPMPDIFTQFLDPNWDNSHGVLTRMDSDVSNEGTPRRPPSSSQKMKMSMLVEEGDLDASQDPKEQDETPPATSALEGQTPEPAPAPLEEKLKLAETPSKEPEVTKDSVESLPKTVDPAPKKEEEQAVSVKPSVEATPQPPPVEKEASPAKEKNGPIQTDEKTSSVQKVATEQPSPEVSPEVTAIISALSGIWPTVFLVLVFAMLLVMADYLDGTDTPRISMIASILGMTGFLTAIQPQSGLSRGDFFTLRILANILLVFGIVYIALVMGYLTSATAVLTASCLLTFSLAAIEDIIT